MTDQPNSPESIQNIALSAFREKQASAGVLVVRELVGASDEDREMATKNTAEYLRACNEFELRYFANNLEYLYATTSAIGQGIRLIDVDLFARAFFDTLYSKDQYIFTETATKLGNIVLRGRYLSQDPHKVVFPFNYEANRKLLFPPE